MPPVSDRLVYLEAKPVSSERAQRSQIKVALTRCPIVVSQSGLSAGLLCPPLGLAYLAAAVREHGYSAAIIDPVGEAPNEVHSIPGRGAVYYGWSIDKIIEAIPADSKYIGVSCMFSQEWPVSKQLLTAIRERFPDSVLIIGGEHVTAAPEASLRDCGAVDYAVLGEGEETLIDLIDALEQGRDPASVPGIAFLRQDQAVQTLHRERVRSVDQIPRPAWDLAPVENYLSEGLSFGVSTGRTMPILATRGCPYQCTFCSNPIMWTTRWYARSPKDVADEIQSYVTRYRANNFDFYDLTAIIKKDWIKEFCQELIGRNLNITWQLPAGTRSEAIDSDVALLLARSGHRNLVYAPETGSEAMLKSIKKKVHLGRMAESMKGAIRSGISIKLNMIMGFPQETRKDIFKTLRFLAKMAWLGVDDVTVTTFVPYPGSAMFDDLRQSGRIGKLDDDFYYGLVSYADAKNVNSFSEHLNARELTAYRLGGMLLFYGLSYTFRPHRLFQTLWRLWRHDHRTRIEKALDSLFSGSLSRRSRRTQLSGADDAAVRPSSQ